MTVGVVIRGQTILIREAVQIRHRGVGDHIGVIMIFFDHNKYVAEAGAFLPGRWRSLRGWTNAADNGDSESAKRKHADHGEARNFEEHTCNWGTTICFNRN